MCGVVYAARYPEASGVVGVDWAFPTAPIDDAERDRIRKLFRRMGPLMRVLAALGLSARMSAAQAAEVTSGEFVALRRRGTTSSAWISGVLNIGVLAGVASVDYYLTQVASDVEDYYMGRGERPAGGPAPRRATSGCPERSVTHLVHESGGHHTAACRPIWGADPPDGVVWLPRRVRQPGRPISRNVGSGRGQR